MNVGCCGFGRYSFGCCGFGRPSFGCFDFGCCEYSLWRQFWMLFGGYEHWMLRFWTLRKLDATLLDALIATPPNFFHGGRHLGKHPRDTLRGFHVTYITKFRGSCWPNGHLRGISRNFARNAMPRTQPYKHFLFVSRKANNHTRAVSE